MFDWRRYPFDNFSSSDRYDFVFTRNKQKLSLKIHPYVRNNCIQLYIVYSYALVGLVDLYSFVLCRNDQLIIRFCPYYLNGLSLHFYCLNDHHSCQIDNLNARVYSFTEFTSNVLSSVTEDDLLATLYGKLGAFFKFGQ